MYWFIFCKDDLLLTDAGAVPQSEEAPVALQPWHHVMHLPDVDGVACRAVCVEYPVVTAGFRMEGLRRAYRQLPATHYAMAGKARELLYWDAQTRFCGVCGAPMKFHTDISKRCTECGKEVWPQLAIATIVAVSKGDQLLMVQGRNFRADYMGLVAGFVETGETLEECVSREVREETGLEIKNIKYFGSQPWPYPCGLMVGFTADYCGGTLRLQRSELSKGGWFAPEDLRNIAVPGKLSIARRLIDNWLSRQKAADMVLNDF